MNLRWSHLRLAMVLALVVGAMGVFAQSAVRAGPPAPVVRVSPDVQTAAAGSEVQVDIVIQSAPTFAAYEFFLAFDPAVLAFDSLSGGGDILENAGRDALCLGPDPQDLDNAIIRYGCASSGGSGGPSGSGVLATLTFNALCGRSSDLTFVPGGKDLSVDAVSISDVLGNSIDTQGIGGTVNVTGAPCSGGALSGDANCDGSVNAIDAAIVLQINAGLLGPRSCAENADVNSSGTTDAIDAALILQFVAGLIGAL